MPGLTHPLIRVKDRIGKLKLRRVRGLARSVWSNIIVYNNTVSVALRALTERLYFVKNRNGPGFVECPKPLSGAFDEVKYFASALRKRIPALPPVWSREQFVDSYAGLKRQRYANARQRLMLGGISRKHSWLKTFIKAEFYDATTKANPCPRLIQPRSDEYNVEIGKYLRPAEKLVYKAVDRCFGHHVVLKCDPPWERGRHLHAYWSEFSKPCFVGLDASRFDQHVSADALRFEHGVYNSIFKSKELAKLLSWQIDQVGYARMSDGCLRYEVTGCRASGDMNTALGNVIIMCAIAHAYLKGLGCEWRFINDGDDCGIFIDERDLGKLSGLSEHFLRFGFELDIEQPVYELEHVEFCQSRPVCVGETFMMVRNVHKALRQDEFFIDNKDWCSADVIRHATGVCGLSLYQGIPVLDAFYSSMLGSNVDQNQLGRLLTTKQGWMFHASKKRPFAVDVDVTRASFYKAFGLLPDHQVAIEQSLRARVIAGPELHQISPSLTDKTGVYI